jgi:hypothetical protein
MDYDPADHILTGSRVIGAWVACLAILAVVFVAPPALHRATTVAAQARAVVVAHARAAVKAPQVCQRHVQPVPPGPGRTVQPS